MLRQKRDHSPTGGSSVSHFPWKLLITLLMTSAQETPGIHATMLQQSFFNPKVIPSGVFGVGPSWSASHFEPCCYNQLKHERPPNVIPGPQSVEPTKCTGRLGDKNWRAHSKIITCLLFFASQEQTGQGKFPLPEQ